MEKYAKEVGFENTVFLADDGYSGTNFERPSWKKAVEMIDRGEVETLIVKDLSRLGREYLQVGMLTEFYFPEKGVRFIAINDGVDSLVEGSNDFNPIRNWANELHAKESSTGTYRPYGLDCSGFVDWVFYNVSEGSYVIGHGGGAADQHAYCYSISWDEAMPGDLVFYPEDSHIGIVAGKDDDGKLLIIHCGGSGVVVTGVDGFISISRPLYYSE